MYFLFQHPHDIGQVLRSRSNAQIINRAAYKLNRRRSSISFWANVSFWNSSSVHQMVSSSFVTFLHLYRWLGSIDCTTVPKQLS